MDNIKSLPKRKLITFLQNAKEEENFTFTVNIPVTEARDFVHRMRVELSRFREKVRAKKRIPKHFKMLFIDAAAVDNDELACNITLRRSLSGHDVSAVLDEIFDEVAGGQKLDV